MESQPKMYYKIDEVDATEVKSYIESTFTNENKDSNFNLELTKKLSELESSKQNIFHGFLYQPQDSEVTRKVIGKEGVYFYKTTSECDILYIWHDIENKKFRFWAIDRSKLIHSMNVIKWRIEKHSNPGWN